MFLQNCWKLSTTSVTYVRFISTSVKFSDNGIVSKKTATKRRLFPDAAMGKPDFYHDSVFDRLESKRSLKYKPKNITEEKLNAILSQYSNDKPRKLFFKPFPAVITDVSYILNYKGEMDFLQISQAVKSIHFYYRQKSAVENARMNLSNHSIKYLRTSFNNFAEGIEKFLSPIIQDIVDGNLKVSSQTLLSILYTMGNDTNVPIIIHNAIKDTRNTNHYLYNDPEIVGKVLSAMARFKSPKSDILEIYKLADITKPQPDLDLLNYFLTIGANEDALKLFQSFIEPTADNTVIPGADSATKFMFARFKTNSTVLLDIFNAYINGKIHLELPPPVGATFITHISYAKKDLDGIVDLCLRYLMFLEKTSGNVKGSTAFLLYRSIIVQFFTKYPSSSPEGIEKLKGIIKKVHASAPFISSRFIPDLFSNCWQDKESLDTLVKIGKSYGVDKGNGFFHYNWLKGLVNCKSVNPIEVEQIISEYAIAIDLKEQTKLPSSFYQNMIHALLKDANYKRDQPRIELFLKLWKAYIPYATSPRSAITPSIYALQLQPLLRKFLASILEDVDTSSLTVPKFKYLTSNKDMLKIISAKINNLGKKSPLLK